MLYLLATCDRCYTERRVSRLQRTAESVAVVPYAYNLDGWTIVNGRLVCAECRAAADAQLWLGGCPVG